MTTGALIYLVSACASGEEFVAAFRRYADKNGLFIPIASPIPAGRRGRFAVTLKDGGVMIEGEADIVSSATTPSVLHGRVGMTLRFVEPDIKSKTVLVELEQARLAMRPQPPSVPPRPAQIPAEPRPVPPAPGGRIDTHNARAECVAIGDVDALDVTVPQVAKGGPKFVVPSIPPVGGPARPKSPSTPPTNEKKLTPPNAYPHLAQPKTPSGPTPTIPRPATPSTPPPMIPRPATPSTPPPMIPRPATPSTPPPMIPRPAMPSTPGPVASGPASPIAPTPGTSSMPASPIVPTPGTSSMPASPIAPTAATASMPASPIAPTATPIEPTTTPGIAVATPRTMTTKGVAPANNEPRKTLPIEPLAKDGPRDTAAMAPLASDPAAAAANDRAAAANDRGAAAMAPLANDEPRKTLPMAPLAKDEPRDTVAMPPMQREPRSLARDELAIARTDSDTHIGAPPRNDSDTFPATPVPTSPDDAVPEAMPASSSGSLSRPNGNTGKAALPPPRRTANPKQPTPSSPTPVVPRNPTPASPTPVVPRNATPAGAMPVAPRNATPAGAMPVAPRNATPAGAMPVARAPSPSITRTTPVSPMPVVNRPPAPPASAPPPAPSTPASSARPAPSASAPSPVTSHRPTRLGLPIAELKAPAPMEVAVPQMLDEALAAPDASDEATDVTSIPIVDESVPVLVLDDAREREAASETPVVPGGSRRTVIGVAVTPEGIPVLPAARAPQHKEFDTELMDAPILATTPSSMDAVEPPTRTTAETTTPSPMAAAPARATAETTAPTPALTTAETTTPTPARATAETTTPTAVPRATPPTGMPAARPPVIEEPSGDWTMVPGEGSMTILPRASEPKVRTNGDAAAAKAEDDRKLPTGDWTIARVEDSPDGWSEPSKLDIVPVRARHHTGPPVSVVFGEKPLEVTSTAKQFEIEEATKSGLKIEVDASLPTESGESGVDVSLASTQFATPVVPTGAYATPLPGALHAASMQGAPMQVVPVPGHEVINPSAMMTMPRAEAPMAQPMPMARATPMPPTGSGSYPNLRTVTDGGTNFFRDSGQIAPLLDDSTSMVAARRRRRLVIIIASAVLAVGAGVALLLFVLDGGTKDESSAPPPKAGSDVAKRPAIDEPTLDAAAVAVQPPVGSDAAEPPAVGSADAAEKAEKVEPPPTDQTTHPAPSGECKVTVTSTPAGAEVVQDKTVIGTTPAELSLPCGVETKVVIRKSRYASSTRTVTATAEGATVKVTLGRNTFSVKVTSSPPGATITLGSKSLGVTPAMVKLPALEASTIVISKPGFGTETQKFTPKQNNQSVHVVLKKKGR